MRGWAKGSCRFASNLPFCLLLTANCRLLLYSLQKWLKMQPCALLFRTKRRRFERFNRRYGSHLCQD